MDSCHSLCAQIYKASGRALLAETFTKVILSGELFYFAHMSTGYWPGLWWFFFFCDLGL